MLMHLQILQNNNRQKIH